MRRKKYYCNDDETFLCQICFIDDHKAHDAISIYKYENNIKEELKKMLMPLKDIKFLQEIVKTETKIKIEEEKDLEIAEERARTLKLSISKREEKIKKSEEIAKEIPVREVYLLKLIEDINTSNVLSDKIMSETRDIIVENVKRTIADVCTYYSNRRKEEEKEEKKKKKVEKGWIKEKQ